MKSLKLLGSYLKETPPDYIDLDLKNRPLTLDLSANKTNVNFIIGAAIIWSAFFCLGIIWTIINSNGFPIQPVLMMSVLVLIGLAVLKVAHLRKHTTKTLTFKNKSLVFQTQLPRKKPEITEIPYSQYLGVFAGKKILKTGDKYREFQLITLRHDNPLYTVVLYQIPEENPSLEKWRSFAKELRVPLLFQDGDQLKSIPWHQQEHTLQQRETVSSVLYGSDGLTGETAPPGLKVKRNNKNKKLTVHIVNSPLRLAFKIITPIIIWFLMTGENSTLEFAVERNLLSFVIMIPFALFMVLDMLGDKQLTMTRSKVSLPKQKFSDNEKDLVHEMALKNIQNVTIQQAYAWQNQLVISSNNKRLVFGAGLSKKKLLWLQSYIRAAIVTA